VAAAGIRVSAGDNGPSANLVDGVRIMGNRIRFTSGGGGDGIDVATADGASNWQDPSFRPVVYPENNIVRNVAIMGNWIENQSARGVFLQAGWGGARRNAITDAVIVGNVIRGIPSRSDVSGVFVSGSGGTSD
jgi:hypothetical protein